MAKIRVPDTFAVVQIAPALLKKILAKADKLTLKPAQVMNKGKTYVNQRQRRCLNARFHDPALVPKLKKICLKAAQGFMPLEINPIARFGQLLEYHKGDFVYWHADDYLVPGIREFSELRLLTMVILLDPKSSFKGGEFEIRNTKSKAKKVPLSQAGDAVVFSSMAQHRVKKVTSGRRRTLTLWLTYPMKKNQR